MARHAEARRRADDSLKRYLAEIRPYHLLDRKEEITLGRRARRHVDGAARSLVESNLKFVVRIALEYRNRGLPLADLISEGNLGLLIAASRFDPDRSLRFITYASWWIRKRILAALVDHASLIRVPAYRFRKFARRRAGSGSGQRSPKLQIDSLDEAPGEDPYLRESLTDPDAPSPEEMAVRSESLELLRRSWSRLDPREQAILEWRFGLSGTETLTLKEIGRRIGLTRERVRQIQNHALSLLRTQMRRRHVPRGSRHEPARFPSRSR